MAVRFVFMDLYGHWLDLLMGMIVIVAMIAVRPVDMQYCFSRFLVMRMPV